MLEEDKVDLDDNFEADIAEDSIEEVFPLHDSNDEEENMNSVEEDDDDEEDNEDWGLRKSQYYNADDDEDAVEEEEQEVLTLSRKQLEKMTEQDFLEDWIDSTGQYSNAVIEDQNNDEPFALTKDFHLESFNIELIQEMPKESSVKTSIPQNRSLKRNHEKKLITKTAPGDETASIQQPLEVAVKRRPGFAILSNKGLTPHRSKDVRNPRVRRRNQYERKVKKLKSLKRVYKASQVPHAESGYGGEASGINAKLVRSVKI